MSWKRYFPPIVICAVMLTRGIVSAQEAEQPHFHHVHINSVDPAKSVDYYKTFFGAVPVKFRGASDAVLTDRSFILFTKVDEPAPWKMITGIYHIGWGGVNGPGEFEWRDKKGAEWETGLSTLGTNYYMYAYGPDKEVVEIWTGFQHNRFGHIHLFSDDVAIATKWYVDNLGVNGPRRVRPKPPKAPENVPAAERFQYLWTSAVSTNNGVAINIFATPSEDTMNWWSSDPIDELVATDGRSIDHIAFSYRDIQPVFDRMKSNGVEIVDGIKQRDEYKMKSFFVRGPDKVLIEIVEARPIPEGVWE